MGGTMNTSRGQPLPRDTKLWRIFWVDTAYLLLEMQMKDSHSEPRAPPFPAPSDQPQPPAVLPPPARPLCPRSCLSPGSGSWPQAHPSETGLFSLNRKAASPRTEIQPFPSLGMRISNTHDFVTSGNHRCFHITGQWLHSAQNILHAHHHLEIKMVIRPATRSHYLMHD